ncbi:MAG TPA: hypothetical protein VF172_10140 [Nitrososphaera sp.]|jgi:hypothetical protein
MNLDKAQYAPEEIVTITVANTFYTDTMPHVTIPKATPDGQSLDIVYSEQKRLVNGTAEFMYQIPVENNNNIFSLGAERRYVVVPSDANYYPDTIRSQFFTAKGEPANLFPLIIFAMAGSGAAYLIFRWYKVGRSIALG